jgi:hypothetical protein
MSMDSRLRDELFKRPDIRSAERALKDAIQRAASCTSMQATYVLRDHYRDLSEPRHRVTKWP